MAGGLLNLIAVGNANLILNGNPEKTFFRVAYSKYTNFGLQKFRIDYSGTRDLRLTESSTFTFKIPRYAELLMDTYLVLNIPDIWSPIYPSTTGSNNAPTNGDNSRWSPYEFQWIKDLGTQIIQEVEIICGAFTLSKYPGDYIASVVDRDFSYDKKKLFNQMSGNVSELNNPANAHQRYNTYPNAFFQEQTNHVTNNYIPSSTIAGIEPSIRGRELYIPLNTWFTMNSKCAFPLIATQYNELEIKITLRPIQHLFQIRDVLDYDNNYPLIQPDFNLDRFQLYRFLQSPKKSNILDSDCYQHKINTWNADIHLLSTYAFLSKQEAKLFAQESQTYLIKDVFIHKFDNLYGSKKISIDSKGLVSSWMWFLQRNDVHMRNEWSNYTNWPYRQLPSNIHSAPDSVFYNYGSQYNTAIEAYEEIFTSGNFCFENQKDIMLTMGIVLDGKYRENVLPRGVFDYVEKYTRTNSFAKEGLYCYNFCLDTNPFVYQPSGAINLGKFNSVELELTTYVPRIDLENSIFDVLCDPNTGEPISVSKSNWRLYEYTYNLVIFEERYNVVSFIGGNAGLLYAR